MDDHGAGLRAHSKFGTNDFSRLLFQSDASSSSVVKVMSFESVSPSAVRSIKQQDFLKVWFRAFDKIGRLPSLAAFQPSRLENEEPELMYYDVVHANNDIRYRVTFAGSRLIEAYGFSAAGRDLQDMISPLIWQHVEPLYDTCVIRRLPTYSIFTVTDLKGGAVNYERLLLPFGGDNQVEQMLASIKSISLEADLSIPISCDRKTTLPSIICGPSSISFRPWYPQNRGQTT